MYYYYVMFEYSLSEKCLVLNVIFYYVFREY